jgi:hypothetical protein
MKDIEKFLNDNCKEMRDYILRHKRAITIGAKLGDKFSRDVVISYHKCQKSANDPLALKKNIETLIQTVSNFSRVYKEKPPFEILYGGIGIF